MTQTLAAEQAAQYAAAKESDTDANPPGSAVDMEPCGGLKVAAWAILAC